MEETKMKKIISIAFAAILAGLAISCQKEEAVSDKADAVQYTFNIIVNDRAGFDNDASTKGSESHKSYWESGDRIFLFFKPTDGVLLDGTYATLTYNGSSWDGTVTPGQSSLGDGGTLSAVYVYKLDGSVTPAYSDNKWTIATGNTFYNCQTGVDYTVSDNVISASLDLVAPTNFVQFYVTSATGVLTCDKVKGWKDIAIGSDMAISNVTCTGYMDGFANSGDSNVKEYYGRIVDGTSLNGKACEFSVVMLGKVYERTATPTSDARSFKMTVSTPDWPEAAGKLPGLFTVGKGADVTAGTEDDVQVRFSQGNLVAAIDANGAPTAWKFATNQYDYIGGNVANTSIGNPSTSGTAGDVDLFGWSASNNEGTSTTDNYGIIISENGDDYLGDFYDWGKAYCEKNSITPDNTWRTLSTEEWQYLFSYDGSELDGQNYDNDIRRGKCKFGVTVCSKTNCVVLLPDNWDETVISLANFAAQDTYDENFTPKWSEMQAAGAVCLSAAGARDGSSVNYVGDVGGYWSSTALDNYGACYVFFSSLGVAPDSGGNRRDLGFSVRLISDVK